MSDIIKQNEENENRINLDNLPQIDKIISQIPKKLLTGQNDVMMYLKNFHNYLNVSKRIGSENTKRNYMSNVKQFLCWCNKLNFAIADVKSTLITRNLIICYEKALSSTDLAQNSRALKQNSVRKFFEFWSFTNEKHFQIDLRKAFSADWISTADGNAYRRVPRINEEVFFAIKKVVDASPHISEKFLFYFLAFGCRRSEIADAKINDIDMLNKSINIWMRKTKEMKILPLPNWFTSKEIFDSRHIYIVTANSKRTAKSKGIRQVTGNYIYNKIQSWLEQTEFKGKVEVTPHAFRRFFVSQLLRQGANESKIAQLGGWKSLQVLSKYGYDIQLSNNPIVTQNMVKY